MDYNIRLNNIKCFAHHGVYEEERVVGGWFEVNLTAHFYTKVMVQNLTDTVNYVKLHQIVIDRMNSPQLLLETLCEQISSDILEYDIRVYKIEIKINKISPPIKNFSGNIEVCLTRLRN